MEIRTANDSDKEDDGQKPVVGQQQYFGGIVLMIVGVCILLSACSGESPENSGTSISDTPTEVMGGQAVNSATADLINALPVSILIDEVLNAPEGANVELPPGIYGGTFALPLWQRREWTTITGASGDEPTVLIGGLTEPLFVDLPLGFTVANMELRSFGHPIVGSHRSMVTFDSNVILPANPEHSVQAIDALFTNYQGESLRLINNRISSWGIGQQNSCKSLIAATTAEVFVHALYSFGELHVQHNVFENNQCESLMRVHHQGDLTVTQAVAPNLFPDLPVRFFLTPRQLAGDNLREIAQNFAQIPG